MTTQGDDASTGLTVTKPSSVSDGDIVILGFYHEGTTVTLTAPLEWTLAATSTSGAGSTGVVFKTFWLKHVSTTGASWQFSFGSTSRWRTGICGVYGPASSVSANSTSAGNGGNLTALALTCTATNEIAVFLGGNFNGVALSTGTGSSAPCIDQGGLGGAEMFDTSTKYGSSGLTSTHTMIAASAPNRWGCNMTAILAAAGGVITPFTATGDISPAGSIFKIANRNLVGVL
jgi:hypothetical protein